ncbi:hypothetical protein ACA910_014725 [Epithemia clementina (nom. ined.)]
MWSSKKKRSAAANSSNNNSSSGTTTTTSNGLNLAAIEKMFAEFADDDDPQTASMDGICKLGEKLGMDATEDIRILVLLWKMNVKDKPSQMSQSEWISGCTSLQVDSWDKLRALLPSLDTGFLDSSDFKLFFKFCFVFSRQGTHKSLDKDLVVALLKLILLNPNATPSGSGDGTTTTVNKTTATATHKKGLHPQRVTTHRVEIFTTFLEQTPYTHISLDQWTSFLDFCLEIDDDLSNYDESTSAWPVILDEYVEYMEDQMKQQPPPQQQQQQQKQPSS